MARQANHAAARLPEVSHGVPVLHADGRVPDGAWAHRGARRADLRWALRRGERSEGVEAPGGVTAMDGGSRTQPDKRLS